MSSEDVPPPAPDSGAGDAGAPAGEILEEAHGQTHEPATVTFADDDMTERRRALEVQSESNLADAAMDALFVKQRQSEGGLRSWKAMRSRAVKRQLLQMSRATSSRLTNVRKMQTPSVNAVMPHMIAPDDIDPGLGVEPPPTSRDPSTDALAAGAPPGQSPGGASADSHLPRPLESLDSTASLRPSLRPSREPSERKVENVELEPETAAEEIDEKEDKLAAWLQCSGLHTVGKWVLNYRKHPSCWAALLMLHGVPEVSGRLRAKVENYAIYSALFLSCTIAAVMDPPPAMDCERREFEGDYERYRCEVAKRVAAYALIASIAMHFLAIILAMAFVNALNECARESDVFRVFARGQGFLATYKCQKAFRLGSACTMVAVGAVSLEMIGWDAVAFELLLAAYVVRTFTHTSHLLFSNGSLVNYWRTELGGKPDEDDPYDIQPAVEVFKERLKYSHGVLGDPLESAKMSMAGSQTSDGRSDGSGKGSRGILGRLRSSNKTPRLRMDGKSAEESDSGEEEAIDRLRKNLKREKNKEKKKRGYVDQHGNHHGSKAAAIL